LWIVRGDGLGDQQGPKVPTIWADLLVPARALAGQP
jgi:hypothetical protein